MFQIGQGCSIDPEVYTARRQQNAACRAFSRFSEAERRTFCMAGPPVTEPNSGHREVSYFSVNGLYTEERKSPDRLNNLLFFLPKNGLASNMNQVRVQGTPVAPD
jgi:hypothetical protein